MIKSLFAKLHKWLGSLRVRFFVVFGIALVVGIALYLISDAIATTFIDNIYLSSENKEQREKEFLDDLQNYIYDNEITADETAKIGEWAKRNKYVYLLIYRGDELFFTSDDVPKLPEKPEADPPTDEQPPQDGTNDSDSGSDSSSAESGEADDGDNIGGITVDYPTREELLEYAKQNEMHLLELVETEEGNSLEVLPVFAQFAEFTEYLYYDLINVFALLFAAFAVVTIMMIYIGNVTDRIIKLGENVNVVAAGAADSTIAVSGNDELSELAANVESMRSAIVENYRKEKEALDANNALITSMSHDIRTPLTILLGYIDVMRQHAGEDDVMQSYLKAAESTAMRLKKLSDDMFSYFLVFGNREVSMDIQSYDAQTLLEQLLSEHILLMKENGYDVDLSSIDSRSIEKISVRTDAQALLRIIDNMFSNLYKYSDKSKPIKIELSVEACQIIVNISNSIRRDGERVESNGIGLKTCKKLAELTGAGFDFCDDGNEYSVKLTLPFDK